MASPSTTRTPRDAERPEYAERLRVPFYWWPLGLILGGIGATELALAGSSTIPYLIVLPLTLVWLAWIGRLRVRVTADELLVDDARLPRSVIADAIPVDANGKRELLGIHADPLAFVIARPWVGGAVQVVLNDPDDPTPYWVISSRRPTKLAALLTERRPGDVVPARTDRRAAV